MQATMKLLALLAAVAIVAGCDSSRSSSGPSNMDALAARLDKPEPVAQPQPQPEPQPQPPPQPEPQPAQVVEKHNVEDVDTSNHTGGYYGAIAAANRSVRDRLDDIAWKKSVQLYQATNGRLPKNTEEFLNLVQSEGTPLPPIEEGNKYEYDPSEGQFGTLYEVAPATPSTPAAPPQ
jgi:hypothetical protein